MSEDLLALIEFIIVILRAAHDARNSFTWAVMESVSNTEVMRDV